MSIHDKLKELTAYVRKTKGSVEALNFYIEHIQPIKEYFGGDEKVKSIDIPEVDNCFSKLPESAKEKLDYILGSHITRNFPNDEPDKEWAGAVLDFLEIMELLK